MTTDLDTAYNALKATEDGTGPAFAIGDPGETDEAAVEALAQCFAAHVWSRAGGDKAEYKRLYDDLGPRAMAMITAVVGVLRDLASGENNAQLEAFLNGVARGQA